MQNIYTRKSGPSRAGAAWDDTRADVELEPTVADVGISAKSLHKQQQERARGALRALREEMRGRGENQTDLARLLSVKQQTVSRALADGPVGVKLAHAVAHARGQTFEELLEGKVAPRTFGQLDGWRTAAEVVVEERRASRSAVRAVARWPLFLEVERADPWLIADLVALWIKWSPLHVRVSAEGEPPSSTSVVETTAPTPVEGTLRVPASSRRREK